MRPFRFKDPYALGTAPLEGDPLGEGSRDNKVKDLSWVPRSSVARANVVAPFRIGDLGLTL